MTASGHTEDNNIHRASESGHEHGETVVDAKEVDVHLAEEDDEGEDIEFEENCWSRLVMRVQHVVGNFYKTNRRNVWLLIKGILLLAFLAYVGYCIFHRFGDEGSIRLLVVTMLVVVYIVYKLTLSSYQWKCTHTFKSNWTKNEKFLMFRKWMRRALYVLFLTGVAVYVGVVVSSTPDNIRSLLGVLTFIVFGFLFSTHPARINWHPVFWGHGVQFIFALLILRTSWGFEAFNWLGHRAEEFVHHGDAGAKFVFGQNYRDHRIAFGVMPVVIFFNSIIYWLYYQGVIQVVVSKLGGFLAFCLDTGPIESVVASANIFIGLTEAPLLVRPFLKKVTTSEIHAIMTCGFASVSGAVMGSYILYGVPANHLLSASVMSAPAALAITKLMCPETKVSAFRSGVDINLGLGNHKNGLAAISSGATAAVKIVANTLANMIAFVSVLNLADQTLLWLGDRAGVPGLTFELLCSYVFFPLAFVMGVATDDCGKVASMIGLKIFTNPFVAYVKLGTVRQNRLKLEKYITEYNSSWSSVGDDIYLRATNVTLVDGVMQERSEVIGTYALCGFSTIAAIGITLGTLVPIVPEKKPVIVSVIVRTVIAGNIACFMTAGIAGLLYEGRSFS